MSKLIIPAFYDAEFLSAAEKERVFKAWARFVKGGFKWTQFTKALYEHLIMHCSFIAHYDRAGFYDYYFTSPVKLNKFLDQFDKSKGCKSIEYGSSYWFDDVNYADLNHAMVDFLAPFLPEIRGKVTLQELQQAQDQVRAWQKKVDELKLALP